MTGEKKVLGRFCWSERERQGWVERLFSKPNCGPDAIYFEQRTTPCPPMKR